MIDLLLKFDSQEQAGLIGEQLGYTTRDPETGEFHTTQATLTLAICVIGEHFIPQSQPEDPEAEPAPPVGDGKWWVMVRSLVDMELPPEILPFVVERNPDDPDQPQNHWA